MGNYDLGEGVSAPKVVVKVLSKENAEKEEIKSFSYEAVYEYIIGKDAPDSIELPEKIKAVVGEKEKEVSVKWSSDKEYKKDEAGEYTFTAELPKEYSLADGVEAPKVVVTLKEAVKTYEVIVSGTKTVITVEGNFPEGSELIAAKVENKLSNDMLNASNKLNNFLSTSAYDIKVVKDGAKVDLPEGSVAKVTIRTDSEFSEDTKLVHVKTDLIDDQGNLKEDVSGSVVNDIKSGAVQTEVVEDVQINGDTLTFELKSFSTIITAAPGEITGISKLEINYKGVNYDLMQPHSTVLNFGYRDEMNLHVEAQFGAGTEKEISITIPEGLSFRKVINTAEGYDPVQYVVNGADNTLKEKIVTTSAGREIVASSDGKVVTSKADVADKFGVEQHNGTITLKFYGDGEANDTKTVSFDVPIYGASRNDYRKEYWGSGTAWFYDRIPNALVTSEPVRVVQSMKKLSDEIIKNEYKLDELTFKNDDSKSYGTSWKSSLKPEIKEGGQMSGNESFWVRPTPNGEPYTNDVAYKSYSITLLAPEFAEFKGFKELREGYTPNYKGAVPVVTNPGDTTPNGYEIPAGYKGYTFTVSNSIVGYRDITVFPMWSFPSDKYPAGTEVTVKVADVKARYYGREYAADQYENFEKSKYPSLTYFITGNYEEVFANVKYQDDNRQTDGINRDFVLYMGAPGFEHTQERNVGYFMIGNRGTKDSKAKTITLDYDINNTGAVGITEQRIPASIKDDHEVSNIYVKTWNSKTGVISDWTAYSGDNRINLLDLGIAGNSGIYLKAVKFDIDTIPSQSTLADLVSRDRYAYVNGETTVYRFSGVVLSKSAVSVGATDNTAIEHKITIENKDGNDVLPVGETLKNSGKGQKSAYTTITGRFFNGLYGKSLVLGNNLDNDPGNIFEIGTDNNLVYSKVHFHSWTQPRNAQYMDAVYLISPYGEEYEDIKVNYGDKYAFRDGKWTGIRVEKKYHATGDAPQPEIIKIPNSDISQDLRDKYPDAVVYKLDFTKINAAQARYNTRQIGGSVLSEKSLKNTPLSTGEYLADTRYNGAWLSFRYSPGYSANEGIYDDLMWVEYNTDTDVPIEYMDNVGRTHIAADKYHLTGKNKMIAPMGYIQLKKAESLVVSSSAKQSKEVDGMYRTYVAGDPSTVMGMYNDANYKLTVENTAVSDVKGFAVYFPIPKAGENWGGRINPEGEFKFTTNLANALRNVPNGFEVYYARSASPTAEYEKWDSYTWTKQSDTSGWTASDWNAVNFVKMVLKKDAVIKKDDGKIEAVFDITVDTANATEAQMYKTNVWSPYFLRKYTSSSSWVKGLPVATMLTPGMLKGFVWEDINVDGKLNGKFDEGEKPVKDVVVELYDTSTGIDVLRVRTKTDEDGKYVFYGLKDGTAATEHNVYKIVVYRDGAKFTSFTELGDDMEFTPSVDHTVAVLEGLDASSGDKVKEYGTGLVAESVAATSPVLRKFVQGGPASASTFNFILEADPANSDLPYDMADDDMPMPDGTAAGAQSVTAQILTANQGETQFKNITFHKEGTYAYKVRELNTGQANYRYDETVYRIVYDVTEVETQSGVRKVYVEMSVLRNDEVIDDNAGLTFTNVYTAPGGGGGGGGGGTPTKPTPKPTPAAPVTPAGEVLGARRTDPEQQVLGARRGTNKGSVLGARRGKTGEASNASRIMVIAGLSAMIALLARASRRKKED